MINGKFKLDDLPKGHPFKVPDNYFEELTTRIQEQTNDLKEEEIISFVTWSWKRTAASVAAVAAIAILGYLSFMPKQETISAEPLAGVQHEVIIDFLIQQNIPESDIEEHLDFNKQMDLSEEDMLNNLNVSDNALIQSIDVSQFTIDEETENM